MLVGRTLRYAVAAVALAIVVSGCGPTLFGWGFNSSGQLGDGTTTGRRVPTGIGTATDWSLISASYDHTCGLREASLWCWGSNFYGELGTSDNSGHLVPTRIGTATNWRAV